MGAVTLHHVPSPVLYSNLNLNIPSPVPAGEAPASDQVVQHIPVQAIGRPVFSFTPQITEVRPQLKITDKSFDVPVPKAVYKTQEITPIHHKYVAEPYAVPHPYVVPQPYALPIAHPVHHIATAPAFAHTAVAYGAAPAITYGVVKS
ncbi:hypothetical protein OTU49_002089 [Cherax quadricarinatus]|uniref:Uncharacterized protein n=1 Tax=Cherax quadricarinatus TaxID=27406 RepID=A0AAW0XCJ2_CHEQU